MSAFNTFCDGSLPATLFAVLAGARLLVAAPPGETSWARIAESGTAITIESDMIEAVIPKRNPKCWMTGIEKGSFLDKTTGFREAGDGLCVVDWLMEPGSDEPWRDRLKAGDRYLFNNAYHGKRAKHVIEGPQLSTSTNGAQAQIIRGSDFVAVKTTCRYEYAAAPGHNAGSLLTQLFVFPKGKRYFFLMDRIDCVNDSDELFLRIDMPGSLRHRRGETFSEIYLGYLGGTQGLHIPSAEFENAFPPDEKFNYRRGSNALPARFIRGYRLRDPKTGQPGPWLAGMTLEPSVVYEAWCNQRPGIVICIEEIGGHPIKAGESFSAVFIVGYFDTLEEMNAVYDRHRGCTALSADGSENFQTR